MNKLTPLLPIIFFINFHALFGQVEVIEITYDSTSNSLLFGNLPKKVKANKDYVLMLTKVNSAHVGVVSQLSAYDYISDLPDILKPIFLGIPNTNVMGQFELDSNRGNTRLFLNAMNHYDKLQKIRSAGNDYYEKTKFNPIPGDTIPLHNLKKTLGLDNVKAIANQLLMSEQFILNAIESYRYSIKTIDVRDPMLEVIHTEYATLNTIKDRIESGVFRKSLQFLIDSERAKNQMNIDTFTASKDVTEVHLQVVNTYTGVTVFEGDLNFKTYHNWSFDFTTGFFYSNRVEKKYYLENRDESFNWILKEDIPEVDISIGALGHFSYKFSPSFMAGISVGASLSPFDGKLRYLTGTSLLFGEQKYVGINIGVAFAKIASLSDGTRQDSGGYYQSKDMTSINTVERIETGLYIGLTYNFINKKQ
ncbi:hypothetical protein [Gelidibacter salicanalis]|uniref:Uncharacterized protein n=1 Tax=Gelidibacter salicanalis TaxID=291193 RepID=A0A934KWX6_9FLAO|nr:hypothetical protein [Gelidibacter salicanalis]MBJ7882806.1 hypothetical protein [Gelidibacter salicanalis]